MLRSGIRVERGEACHANEHQRNVGGSERGGAAADAGRRARPDGWRRLGSRRARPVRGAGKIKGAVNVSRGMLEFRADPESPYYNPAFQKDKTMLIYCASGGRSALVGKTLKDFGYGAVYNIGGFKELADAGLETEPA